LGDFLLSIPRIEVQDFEAQDAQEYKTNLNLPDNRKPLDLFAVEHVIFESAPAYLNQVQQLNSKDRANLDRRQILQSQNYGSYNNQPP
jgi:hypothetical protein